jgi:hypothetical protein
VVEKYDRAGVVYENSGVKVIAFDVDDGDASSQATGTASSMKDAVR